MNYFTCWNHFAELQNMVHEPVKTYQDTMYYFFCIGGWGCPLCLKNMNMWLKVVILANLHAHSTEASGTGNCTMLLCQVWGFAGLSRYRHPAHVWALLNPYHNATQVFFKHFYQPNLGPRLKSSIWREAYVEGQSCFFRGAAVSLAVASISKRFASSMLSFSRVCCIQMDWSQIKMPFSRHGIF